MNAALPKPYTETSAEVPLVLTEIVPLVAPVATPRTPELVKLFPVKVIPLDAV